MKAIMIGALLATPMTAMAQTASEPLIRVIGAASRNGVTSATGLSKRPVPADLEQYRRLPPADSARAVLIDFAQCLYKTQKAGLMKFTALVPGQRGFAAAAEAASDNQCMAVGDMAFRPSSFYGAAYVVRYRADHPTGEPVLSPTPVDYAALAKDLTSDERQFYVSSRMFADCVVRKDPVAARSLVISPAAGTGEAAAFAAINPNLGACLTQGATVKLTKDFLKGTIAEVLYRNAAAG